MEFNEKLLIIQIKKVCNGMACLISIIVFFLPALELASKERKSLRKKKEH